MTPLTCLSLALATWLSSAPDRRLRRLAWLAATRFGATASVAPKLGPDVARVGEFVLGQRAVISAVAAVVGWFCVGPVVGLVVGAVVGAATRSLHHAVDARRADHRRITLGAAMSGLLDELDSGAAPAAAFAGVARAGGWHAARFDELARELASGFEPRGAENDADDLAPLSMALAVAWHTGCPLRETITGVASDLAAQSDLHRGVRTAATGPRSAAFLLALLPIVGIAMGTAMGAAPLRILSQTAIGQVALVIGAGLNLLGLAWTSRLTNGVLRC